MNLALITDAWLPQVNGVVTTLVELVREVQTQGHDVTVLHPGLFRTRPCPGYAGIDLAVRPYTELARQLDVLEPDTIHIATEGPLGWAARRYCLRRKLRFTTAFHTRFPEILHAALKVPLWLGYAAFRHFHRPSSGVMVPTQSVLRMLEGRGFRNLRGWTHGVDMALFQYRDTPEAYIPLGNLAHPVALFVGRISYEKNIEAFLALDIPGTKVVCGVGPLEDRLKERYPRARWLGVLPRDELAKVYAAADVFVMPSRSETFGLVMLEAMACGTPVAAFPVEGPLEVVGSPPKGGVLDTDLKSACYGALALPRSEARSRAMEFSWTYSSQLFMDRLVPVRQELSSVVRSLSPLDVTKMSSNT
ncbi:MAG: glycosyltransferase family 1 protein [Burkholderiales bacterium]|nr:glycosyltransferase family 1 protein [Burkholderiales bacterium]